MDSEESINKFSNTDNKHVIYEDNVVSANLKIGNSSKFTKELSLEEIDDEQYDIDSLGKNKVRNRRYSIVDTLESGHISPSRRQSLYSNSFKQLYAPKLQHSFDSSDDKNFSNESLDDNVVDLDSLGRDKVCSRRYSIFNPLRDSNRFNQQRRSSTVPTYDSIYEQRIKSDSNSEESLGNQQILCNFSRRNSSCLPKYSMFDSPKEARVLPIRRISITSINSNSSVTGKSEKIVDSLGLKVSKSAEALNANEEELKSDLVGDNINDDEIKLLIETNKLSISRLESFIGDLERSVIIRREVIDKETDYSGMEKIPFENYDYSQIFECCCENTIGYVPVPIGIIGPILINDKMYRIPLATTEGCLVASANRGCRALRLAGGVQCLLTGDSMTRGPVTRFPSAKRAVAAYNWLSNEENYLEIKKAFDSTSRYARLQSIKPKVVGKYLFIRFAAKTGNAMGMNMVSKGTEAAIDRLSESFPDIEMSCLSGNFCSDKKASIENWTEGRGKSVVAEAWIPEHIVRDVLKTTIEDLVDLNTAKNLIGSTIAGTIGGYNAHAANIVAAIFIATGQDPAQVVCSSNCITIMESCNKFGNCLYMSCTMPSLEVGTIGGGTHLTAQRGCLELLRLNDNSAEELSKVVCSAVMAGELSLLSALSAGDLIKSHMKLNRLKKS